MNGTVNAYLADRKKLSRFNKSIWFCCVLLISKTKKKEIKKNNTLVSGNAGDEKNLHPRAAIFFSFDRFSGDILFSSLVSFAFFDSCFFLLLLVCCFLNLKMYILIQIPLCGWVSDSHPVDFWEKDFWPNVNMAGKILLELKQSSGGVFKSSAKFTEKHLA